MSTASPEIRAPDRPNLEKLQKRLCRAAGKDSFAMLDVLMLLKERAPISFELVAVNMDQ